VEGNIMEIEIPTWFVVFLTGYFVLSSILTGIKIYLDMKLLKLKKILEVE
jgi:hypothetical protein